MEMVEQDGRITFILDSGNKINFNKEYVTEVGQMLGRLCRLEKAFRRVMDMPSDEIAEIVEAHADGRLTVWPREGQMIWYDAKGCCEGCPMSPEGCDWGEGRYPNDCPSYVGCEPWRDCYRNDPDEAAYWMEGKYFKTREACEEAIRKEQEGGQ